MTVKLVHIPYAYERTLYAPRLKYRILCHRRRFFALRFALLSTPLFA